MPQALCTEATLNAVQRRYPQIYKSNDRLLLKPEAIEVELRDFMISVNDKSVCLIRILLCFGGDAYFSMSYRARASFSVIGVLGSVPSPHPARVAVAGTAR